MMICRDLQVLTPMNRGTLGTRALNGALQARLNATGAPAVERFGSRFTPGDKIIQMVDNYRVRPYLAFSNKLSLSSQ